MVWQKKDIEWAFQQITSWTPVRGLTENLGLSTTAQAMAHQTDIYTHGAHGVHGNSKLLGNFSFYPANLISIGIIDADCLVMVIIFLFLWSIIFCPTVMAGAKE